MVSRATADTDSLCDCERHRNVADGADEQSIGDERDHEWAEVGGDGIGKRVSDKLNGEGGLMTEILVAL